MILLVSKILLSCNTWHFCFSIAIVPNPLTHLLSSKPVYWPVKFGSTPVKTCPKLDFCSKPENPILNQLSKPVSKTVLIQFKLSFKLKLNQFWGNIRLKFEIYYFCYWLQFGYGLVLWITKPCTALEKGLESLGLMTEGGRCGMEKETRHFKDLKIIRIWKRIMCIINIYISN